MAKYSLDKINRLINESDNASNPDIKGAKLEELVKYLFGKIPKITHVASNVLDGYRAHELDVVFINDGNMNLNFLSTVIITECKNTTDGTSSAQVGWFIRKLQDRGLNTGILITLSGITGIADGESNAHSEVVFALVRDKIAILIIKRAEILGLQYTEDLIGLLRGKYLRLIINRTID